MGRKVCLNTIHLGKTIRKPCGTDRKVSHMIPGLHKANYIVSPTSNPNKIPNYPSLLFQDILTHVWEPLLLNSKLHYISNQSLPCLLVFVWCLSLGILRILDEGPYFPQGVNIISMITFISLFLFHFRQIRHSRSL